jgi:excisionase family DNA binding protein
MKPAGRVNASTEILCADEVASWFKVDRKSIYNAVARGDIPHQRLGKRVLFHRNALVAWLMRAPQRGGS